MRTSISLTRIFTFLFTCTILLVSFSDNAFAAKNYAVKFDKSELKAPTAKFLIKTSKAIQAAYTQLQSSKIFTGDLARAVAHQRHALELFKAGLFQRAAYHSKMARQFAVRSLQANKASATNFDVAQDEKSLFTNGSTLLNDSELENELKKKMAGKAFSDQEFINGNITDIAESRIK
jgi:hypothetical protein